MLNRTHTRATSSRSWCSGELRYRLTLRDLAEMFLIRGIVFSYEAVREWEAKLTPILSDELRQRCRRRRLAASWYVDETYIKVRGRWCYLYRAIDRNGALVGRDAERAPRSRRSQGVLSVCEDGDRDGP